MARIKLNLRKLSIPEKIAKGRQIVTSMTSNPTFPTPQPSLAIVGGTITDLEDAFTAVQTAKADLKMKVVAQDAFESALDQTLTQLAAYVESVAGSDETKITSAGMDVKAAASAPVMPSPPQALVATAGDHDGQIDLSWDTVLNAKSYTIQQSVDSSMPGNWVHAGVSTNSTKTITGLTSGSRYWFRVAAVGTVGQSGWSDPATKIAP